MTANLTTGEQEALRRFKDEVQGLLGDRLLSLRLFGSRARGEGTAESDLDVLIILREKDRSLCRRIVEAALDVDLACGVNLAPTILTEEEYQRDREYRTPFYSSVEREGVPL